jgi:hypothetical protein
MEGEAPAEPMCAQQEPSGVLDTHAEDVLAEDKLPAAQAVKPASTVTKSNTSVAGEWNG